MATETAKPREKSGERDLPQNFKKHYLGTQAGSRQEYLIMCSLRETRNKLFLAHSEKVISDEEFLLLFDVNIMIVLC